MPIACDGRTGPLEPLGAHDFLIGSLPPLASRHFLAPGEAAWGAVPGDGPDQPSYTEGTMSSPEPASERPQEDSLELPVEELLRRGRPHPPYGEQVIEDLTPEKGDAFLEAIRT